MAETYKPLAQSSPAATTNTDLYTVPTLTSAVTSTLFVCNRGTSSASFRVAIRPLGAAIANAQYIYYDVSLARQSTFSATVGLTLQATDVVTVYSATANLSFSLFGTEIT